MIHDLDLILSVVASPVREVREVRASGVPVLTGGVDIGNARIEFENGCVANLTASRVSADTLRKMRIFQKDEYLSIDFGERRLSVARRQRDPERPIAAGHVEAPPGDALMSEARAFVEAARTGGPAPVTGEDGRRALALALRACGVQPRDEVITTPLCFMATASAIPVRGAKPVFVDIDPRTYNLDPERVEAAIGPKTRAIVPVHLYGQPARLEPLAELCRRHNLRLIEEAAQSFGAEYGGRKSGACGDLGCSSLYPSKNLGAFGYYGGMVITDDDELAYEVRALANHGSRSHYHHSVLGYNSRQDELQAAILRVKLKRVDTGGRGRRRAPRPSPPWRDARRCPGRAACLPNHGQAGPPQGRSERRSRLQSVTAPRLALDTERAYLASTPRV